MQRDADPRLRFDDLGREPRLELRRSRPRPRPDTAGRAGRPSSRRRSTAPSRTGRRAGRPSTGRCRARKPTGRPLTIATRPSPRREAGEHLRARRRSGRASLGAFDDRRQRSVEVDEQRGAVGALGQRGNRCVDVDHGGTLPGWTRRTSTEAAPATVDRERERLVALSHRIHAHPELKFEEEQSSAWTAGALSDAGLPVDAGICDLPTAFACRIGDGPLHIAICAEYDALPDDRSRVRAQHHRGERGRRRARARTARRRARHHAARSSARRPKRAAAARS